MTHFEKIIEEDREVSSGNYTRKSFRKSVEVISESHRKLQQEVTSYSREIPENGFSREIPEDGFSREIHEDGFSQEIPDALERPPVPVRIFRENTIGRKSIISKFGTCETAKN